MQKTTLIASITGIIFVIGAGTIIYFGRPVMKIEENQESAQVNIPIVNQEDESSENDSEEAAEIGENTAIPTGTTTAKPPTATTTPSTTTPAPTTTTPPATTQAPGTYTAAQVAAHASVSDCWSIVSNDVYDLTSWVSRHPGGSQAIIGMCGKDATSSFTRQHGGSGAAKAALALLKIGTLAQ